jgi:hypothetical protein
MPKAKAVKPVRVVISETVDVKKVLSGIVDALDVLCPRESVHAARTKELRADLREKIAAL